MKPILGLIDNWAWARVHDLGLEMVGLGSQSNPQIPVHPSQGRRSLTSTSLAEEGS